MGVGLARTDPNRRARRQHGGLSAVNRPRLHRDTPGTREQECFLRPTRGIFVCMLPDAATAVVVSARTRGAVFAFDLLELEQF